MWRSRCNVKVQELSNVGALIIGMGFWGLLIKIIV